MKVERSQRYPVSADTLFDVMTDRAFYESRFAMSGIDDYHFEAFDRHGNELVIRIVREVALKADSVPGWAKRFVGKPQRLVQEFVWTCSDAPPYRARYRFAIGSVPVDVGGEVEIRDAGGEAEQNIRMEVDSRVPLIGGKISSFACDKVEKGLDSDYRGTMRYLERQGLA